VSSIRLRVKSSHGQEQARQDIEAGRVCWLSVGWTGGRLKLSGIAVVFISPSRCMRSRSRRAQTA
jgi:hypothetical protein